MSKAGVAASGIGSAALQTQGRRTAEERASQEGSIRFMGKEDGDRTVSLLRQSFPETSAKRWGIPDRGENKWRMTIFESKRVPGDTHV
jgi:hypothetical protein